MRNVNIWFAMACGSVAVLCVRGEEAVVPPLPEDMMENLQTVYEQMVGGVDWSKLSPSSLGMNLDYENMTSEQLDEVGNAAVELGMIEPQMKEGFINALTQPAMRRALGNLEANFSGHMRDILQTPDFQQFAMALMRNFKPNALKSILGLQTDFSTYLRNAAAAASNSQEVDEEEDKEEDEFEDEPDTPIGPLVDNEAIES